MNTIERTCPTPIVSAPGPVEIREFHILSKYF